MNEISTTLYKVNWKFLLKNALKKTFWKNTWKIFEVDGNEFIMNISSIDVANNKLNLVIRNPQHYWNYEYLTIPMDKAHFNEEVFGRTVYNNIKKLLHFSENKFIYELDAYKNARALDDAADEARRLELREEKIAKLGFTLPLDKDQEEVIEAWVDDKFRYKSINVESIMLSLCERYKSEWYGLLALTLGKEKDYDEWVDNNSAKSIQELVNELNEKFKIIEMEEESD